jgi:hypothetical protein
LKPLVAFLLIICFSPNTFSQVISLKGKWKFHLGDRSVYATQKYSDADWEEIAVPSAWEEQGFHGFDGFAWYRISFDGKKLTKDKIYHLNLGYIDDCDEVFFNDSLIGFSGHFPPKFKTAYNNERKYILPSHMINYNGKNVIAVRVFDVTLGGGIVDGNIGIYENSIDKKMLVDLQGIWSFATTWNDEKVSHENDWRKIMVPMAWEFQGYSKYDGYAWYKKTFNIPGNFSGEDLVFVGGKIDDFDRVYLNGKQIGRTNDQKRYGTSNSYQELRVYSIPKDLLKRNGINTIEIFVEDMGNIGGIYEGPIGITTRTHLRFYRE